MRRTNFYRVSDCRNAAGTVTSVCIRHDRLQHLLHFAYGDLSTVNKTVRVASRDLLARVETPRANSPCIVHRARGSAQRQCGASWSRAVVGRAFAKLTGAFDPVKAEALEAARSDAERLAAENNGAWEQVV